MTRSALIAVCVLLTEFSSQKRAEGMSITQAAMSAAKARLRPILMTSLTMIFGMLPLCSQAEWEPTETFPSE